MSTIITYVGETIQRYAIVMLVTLVVASKFLGFPSHVFGQPMDGELVFDFDFESGMHFIDLDYDGTTDVLTIGYISGGTGYTQFDFNFLIERPINSASQQRFFTVIPDDESRNNFTTLQNADCVLKSIRLVKLGPEQNDWKLLILDRTAVPEAGYTESKVEFRLLRLQRGTAAGFPRFSYRQIGNIVSNYSYCNVNDAFSAEWGMISSRL